MEWFPELMKQLEKASDVVCLLTPRSLERPWILYEAGVAKGKLEGESKVFGVALGVPLGKASTGPFAQFQNCDDDEESLTKLVMQLVDRIPDAEPDHDAILMQVKKFKSEADKLLEELATSDDSGDEEQALDNSDIAKLFEEVKVMFRELPSRFESGGGRRKSFPAKARNELSSDDVRGITTYDRAQAPRRIHWSSIVREHVPR